MPEVTMKQLLEAGVHFGHQRRRWNPKMAQFIFTERNGIFIIDLKKTVESLRQACDAVREVVARQQNVLFVGTKKQARDIIEEAAKSCGMFWVTNRWLGGLLTNFRTIRKSVLRLIELEKLVESEAFAQYTKKERSLILHEKNKLEKNLIGVKNMDQLPGLVYIVDVHKEHLAVQEARKMRIPTVAIIDTNCDPDLIDFPIPGNDDAIRSIKLITDQIVASVQEGLALRAEGVIAPTPVLMPVGVEEESMEDLVEKYKDYISEDEEIVDYGKKARATLGVVPDEDETPAESDTTEGTTTSDSSSTPAESNKEQPSTSS